MANKYCNLDGSKKIKDEFKKINVGFSDVDRDIQDLYKKHHVTKDSIGLSEVDNVKQASYSDMIDLSNRVDNILTTPADTVNAQEIIDARNGYVTLGHRLNKYDILDVENKKNMNWFTDAFSGLTFIAHRGYSKSYPENTIKAYVEASIVGFDGWETDPWVSSDGVWFSFHDADLYRMTNTVGSVNDKSWDFLRNLKITGGNGIEDNKGLRIPSMDDVFLSASKQKVKPLIFLNNRSATLLNSPQTKELARVIKKYNYERKTIIFTGINNFEGIRQEIPNIGVCADFGWTKPSDETLDYLSIFAPNVMASMADSVLLANSELINKCYERGIFIQAHVVNLQKNINKLINMGVHIFLSDLYYNITGGWLNA